MLYTDIDSPLGRLLLTGRPSTTAPGGTAIASLSVPGQKNTPVMGPDWQRDPTAFTEAERQLAAYFARETTDFTLEFAADGTEFRRKVWDALDNVPYGETTSYGVLAAAIGAPRAAVRAVGGAFGVLRNSRLSKSQISRSRPQRKRRKGALVGIGNCSFSIATASAHVKSP